MISSCGIAAQVQEPGLPFKNQSHKVALELVFYPLKHYSARIYD
jgi:hypothetical protein